MTKPWTPYCSKKRDYEHAAHCIDDISCSYCGMANPEFLDPSSPPEADREIIEISSSPPAQQSQSTHRFQQLDKSSEIARQQSIARTQTQQKKQERPHAGSLALSARPKLPQNRQSQLISQTFAVNIYAFWGTIYDIDLHLCHDWTSLR